MQKSQLGASLVESMVAMALIASAAVVMFPAFTSSKKTTVYTDFKQVCEQIVRGKLDEYRIGRPINPNGNWWEFSNNCGNTYSALTPPTLSNSATGGPQPPYGSFISYWGASAGFFYAKIRYNQYLNNNGCAVSNPGMPFTAPPFTDLYSCNGVSQAAILQPVAPALPPVLGMRECIGTNFAWKDSADPSLTNAVTSTNCPGPEDQRLLGQLPGFKLYVRLQLATPWKYGFDTSSAPAPGPNSDYCPIENEDVGYDFGGASDAIQVTVTGVLDITSVGLSQFAGLSDPGRLQCSAQTVVKPMEYPIRYFLNREGLIYRVGGNGAMMPYDGAGNPAATQIVFQSLYDPYTYTGVAPNSFYSSGILSFAVHPRNYSVYVLRPGVITRYSACGGIVKDCMASPAVIAASGYLAYSDAGVVGWTPIQEWTLMSPGGNPAGGPPPITSIGVDFRSGIVYGRSSEQFYQIQDYNGGAPQPLGLCTGCALGNGAQAVVTPITPGPGVFPPWPSAFPATAGQQQNRFNGFFISPEGDTAFVSDWTTGAGSGGAAAVGAPFYSTTIYNLADPAWSTPVLTLPVAAVSFSK